MPAVPWSRGPSSPDTDADCVVLISRLPLRRPTALPRFVVGVAQVVRQLRRSPGLLGWALDAHPLANHYWTLSAWRSQEDIDRFIRTEPHRTVMSSLSPVLGATAFHSWVAPVGSLPPQWADARRRLAEGS